MIIKLKPVDESNRDAVLALSVREDQPFVATNEVSLRQADETNGEDGPFASRLYPIGKKTFGRKGGFGKIEFGDGCLTVGGTVCRKLETQ